MGNIKTCRFLAGSMLVPLLTLVAVLSFGLLVICTMFSTKANEAVKELTEGVSNDIS